MYRVKTITTLQMYFILTLSIGISNHVLLIPVLLQVGKRDAWIGASAALIPLLLWSSLIYVIAKRKGGRKLTDWVKEQAGTAISKLFMLVMAVYCLLSAIVSLRDTVTWTKVTYLPATPKSVVAVLFMLLCCIGARLGIRAIGITSGLLLPMVLALGYFVMTANFKYKDYSLLFPLFTHGYSPMLLSALYTMGGISELVFILILQHHLSTAVRYSGLLVMPVILIGLTVGPLTGAIALFGPFEAADLRFPAFEQWRMVTLGKFISHLDFFSIYQWISGSFVRIALLLALIVDLMDIKRPRSKTIFLIGLSLLITAIALFPISDMTFLDRLTTWYFPSSLGWNLFVTLLLLILAFLPGKRKEVKTG